ncbi:2-oxo acid dehydrogenase subunit E2 [Mucilaginibacter sp. BJC16-A38]|uniref:dihydrolipoamide acetyltransferase family protein n=1 Tax=Mucilaginibacter phenanthrenivorans TaxID=1234842 RepID=UPI002157E2E7|nr:dihydrolipoamide acetyltransferase family protein [Mucilaginibacter phenanthrenivorans]MCR8556814.1 2-oxo acid dehydrogenase subunit E2 [Mucilaginibacter phenanthrenivorans]
MAKYKLLLPKMGESVEEATIIKWTKKPGDYIEADETVMEIATDKVDSEVPSPVSGKLVEQLYKDNDVVKVGAVIAIIETNEPEETKEAPGAPAVHEAATAAFPPMHRPIEEIKPPIQETPPPVISTPPPVYQAPAPVVSAPVPQPEIKQPEEPKQPVFAEPVAVPYIEQLQEKTEDKIDDGNKNGLRFYSPLVKNIAAQEGISNAELDQIPGTGAEGRLTKDDLLAYVQQRSQPVAAAPKPEPVAAPVTPPPAPEPVVEAPKAEPVAEAPKPEPVAPTPAPAPVAEAPKPEPVAAAPEPVAQEPAESKTKGVSVSGGDEIIEMDRMRRLIADHMVMSKHTSPHVTSFVEADVTNLVLWRERIKSSFEKREGEKITFTPIFIEAVVRAIKDLPMINIQVNGTQIIKKKDINISMATALPSGNLIVPVIKKADELNLIGLTKAVNDLANRARSGKLKPDDVQGGTFTITNVGSFGNVMGTPIINQPQVAILAIGVIKKKPAVIETLQGDMIGIRHMMFLSLSYDHRVVDGALGGSFVRRVADYLENWETDREF